MTTVTISGLPGTGTTTIAQLLKKGLDLPYVYAGQIFRDLANEHGMALAEFGAYCEENEEIDKELDGRQLEILGKGDVIIEGRMTGWLAKTNDIEAFKILLTADIKIRVARIMNREGGDLETREKEMIAREKSEGNRYRNYYNADPNDESIYDLTIKTDTKTPEEIYSIILKHLY